MYFTFLCSVKAVIANKSAAPLELATFVSKIKIAPYVGEIYIESCPGLSSVFPPSSRKETCKGKSTMSSIFISVFWFLCLHI